jgi:hypothetical protein
MENLIITNPKIIEFYKEHPSISFEEINILLIDILNKLFIEISPNMDSHFALSIQNQLKEINNNISKSKDDNVVIFSQLKDQYIKDVNFIINSNTNENIKPLLNEYNQNLQEKMKNSFGENIKNEINSSFKDIQGYFTDFKYINEKNIENISNVLKKFENSSVKGIMSENVITHLLKSMYSESQVEYVAKTKNTGDILLKRTNKQVIMIENKDYSKPVDQVEVDKFISNLKEQNMSGIFLSQKSTIANKKQFEISFYENNIGVYISEVNYDTDKIQIGINIIDDIKKKIGNCIEQNEIFLTKQDIDNINDEYTIFSLQKLKHIKTIKDYSKKLADETQEFNIPTLHNILINHFGINKQINFVCEICGFPAKNAGALSSHKKSHKNKELNID